MAKGTYVSGGATVPLTASSAVEAGEIIVAGKIFGVAAGPAASGELVSVLVEGVVDLPKANVAVSLGAIVYWDAANGVITTSDQGTARVGVAVAGATQTAATVRVRLDGRLT